MRDNHCNLCRSLLDVNILDLSLKKKKGLAFVPGL
jgi:hypothetical protein